MKRKKDWCRLKKLIIAKNKLRNHNGLTIGRKMMFIDAFLKV